MVQASAAWIDRAKRLASVSQGLHFYTLNKSFATRSILAAVRKE